MHTWIWQHPDWTAFSWHEAAVQPRLRAVRQKQGELLGRAGVLGDGDQPEQELDTLLANIVSSSSIENETLDAASVRSSLARIMFDAIHHRSESLSFAP